MMSEQSSNSTQSIADYLAQLLKDRKQVTAFPNVFMHVERLIDEGECLPFACFEIKLDSGYISGAASARLASQHRLLTLSVSICGILHFRSGGCSGELRGGWGRGAFLPARPWNPSSRQTLCYFQLHYHSHRNIQQSFTFSIEVHQPEIF